jgi:S1-C subfamily serine protease
MRPLALPILAAAIAACPVADADEGMWPFDMIPRRRIEQEHHVVLTDAWLDHVRLASVRFNVGGSGSFVSRKGLVLTNHHVAADCIAKIASPSRDYLATGYLAGKDGPEIPCPDLEIDELVSFEDVTRRVSDVRTPGMSDAEANRAIKAEMASIEKQCHEASKLRCDVVTFYGGAMYQLYRYGRYTDVRLVFAPEADVAFFGGDPDNFTFPRYDFDLALFRVYDQKQPLASKDWLHWSAQGPKDGDVVFTSGHPGRTNRNATVAELDVLRDLVYPRTLARMGTWREGLTRWAASGPEEKRQSREALFGVENALKALGGYELGLLDPALMRKKEAMERKLRASIEADPALKAKFGGTWDDIERVEKAYAWMYPRYEVLESGLGGSLLPFARGLVRVSAERLLPNDQRLPEYRDTALEELALHVLSSAPLYPGVEEAYVSQWLRELREIFGDHAPLVAQVLAGRSPERAARDIVANTKLYDVYARRALWDGGQAAVAASTDPLIVAMRAVEADARALRKRHDDAVEAPMRVLGRRVAEAMFAVEGASLAPDATFTLRLSVGVAKGYAERGAKVPSSTDVGGMYKHATGIDPYKLPARWIEARERIPAMTPLNFVSTNDVIGGNSGSPVLDAAGNLVGLIFDGNLASLPNRFVYDETTARAISVDAAGMLEALRAVYRADALVEELTSR